MQPENYLNTAFAFISAREQLKASAALDRRATMHAFATALIALRRATEDEINEEALQLFGPHGDLEMGWTLQGSNVPDMPWRRGKDGELVLAL